VDPELEPREWWRKPADWPVSRALLPESMVVCNQEIMALYDELKKMLPLWENIDCPITIFQGSKDQLVPEENALFIREKAVNSPSVDLQIIEGGSHFILWSEQGRIVEKLLGICSRPMVNNE
jgi:pimeloyl-ACP methyl ester carboxylesterase